MGYDGTAQSKENMTLIVKQAAVIGIPTQGQAARFASPTELRAVPRDGDGRRSCCDFPWTRPA